MKEFYEAPEAKFIGFAPMENLAASWDWSKRYTSTASADETTDSQVDVIYPDNPEGDF